jgi:hypothetical protein
MFFYFVSFFSLFISSNLFLSQKKSQNKNKLVNSRDQDFWKSRLESFYFKIQTFDVFPKKNIFELSDKEKDELIENKSQEFLEAMEYFKKLTLEFNEDFKNRKIENDSFNLYAEASYLIKEKQPNIISDINFLKSFKDKRSINKTYYLKQQELEEINLQNLKYSNINGLNQKISQIHDIENWFYQYEKTSPDDQDQLDLNYLQIDCSQKIKFIETEINRKNNILDKMQEIIYQINLISNKNTNIDLNYKNLNQLQQEACLLIKNYEETKKELEQNNLTNTINCKIIEKKIFSLLFKINLCGTNENQFIVVTIPLEQKNNYIQKYLKYCKEKKFPTEKLDESSIRTAKIILKLKYQDKINFTVFGIYDENNNWPLLIEQS